MCNVPPSPAGIIGAGRLGSSLAATLFKQGMPLKVHAHNPIPDPFKNDSFDEVVVGSSLLFLTVQDDAILQTAHNICLSSQMDVQGRRILIICSGSYDLEQLEFVRDKGWIPMKLHPLQSFPTRLFEPFPEGVPWAIQCEEAQKGWIQNLVESWHGQVHFLRAEHWKTYHLAAVLAGNFLPLFIRKGISMLQSTGTDPAACAEWLRPLVMRSVEMGLTVEIRQPFSGPASRGDKKVMQSQQKLLQEHMPEMSMLYQEASQLIEKWCRENTKN